MLTTAIAFLALVGSPQEDFPWETKWHGQRLAVDLISKGEALKGKHFDDKVNRIAEHPWNELQTLLGAYMITRLDEDSRRIDNRKTIEALAIETCASVMTMLSTHQQLYEGHVVYQIDDWRQGDPHWQQVWRAPALAKAILRLTPDEGSDIAKVCGLRQTSTRVPEYRAYNPNEVPTLQAFEFTQRKGSTELKRLLALAQKALGDDKRAEVTAIVRRFEERTSRLRDR